MSDKTNLQKILDWLDGEDWDYFDDGSDDKAYCPICGQWFEVTTHTGAYVSRRYVDGQLVEEDDGGSEEVHFVMLSCKKCALDLEREQDSKSKVFFKKKYYRPKDFFNRLKFLLLTGQELTEEKEVLDDETKI